MLCLFNRFEMHHLVSIGYADANVEDLDRMVHQYDVNIIERVWFSVTLCIIAKQLRENSDTHCVRDNFRKGVST